MKYKSRLLFFSPIALILSCSLISDTKKLDLKAFKITIPKSWNYIKQQGEDSFVGEIKTAKSALLFDYSGMGYANHLIPSEQEYLERQAKSFAYSIHDNDLKFHKITGIEKKKYPLADYILETDPKDSTKAVLIAIPDEIRMHYMKVDSNEKYVFKTIWPKITGKGTTGIYIHSRTSSFNFQLSGLNLSTLEQEQALNAFKTIIFNK